MAKIGLKIGDTHMLIKLTDQEEIRYNQLIDIEPGTVISPDRRAEIINQVITESNKEKNKSKEK
ncbi:MAG: hypothetical protein JXR27_08865 [Paludibacteraceae bacterium]|nr:hypothetical protein [Paludibacteraceae bacterium]